MVRELAWTSPRSRLNSLQPARAALLRHFEWARTGDTDLAALRGTAEFDALFDDFPSGE